MIANDDNPQQAFGAAPETTHESLGTAITPTQQTQGLIAALKGSGLLDAPPFSAPILIIERTRIAGTTHVPHILDYAAQLQRGQMLRFARETENQHDRWAISVFDAEDHKLGYMPVDCNEIPARLMDGGKRLFGKVAGVQQRGSWTKIDMEVYLDD